MSSLKKPSRIDLWLELLRSNATIPEAEDLLGVRGRLFLVDGLETSFNKRAVQDGPAWAPERHVKTVKIGDVEAFNCWVQRELDEDFLEEYDAAYAIFKVEQEAARDIDLAELFKP